MDDAERERVQAAIRRAAEAEDHYRRLLSPVPIVATYAVAGLIGTVAGFLIGSWIAAGVVFVALCVFLERMGFGFSMLREIKERATAATEERIKLAGSLDP